MPDQGTDDRLELSKRTQVSRRGFVASTISTSAAALAVSCAPAAPAVAPAAPASNAPPAPASAAWEKAWADLV
ncbi:MAG: hypothetical protein AAB289_00410, partial [Chloroflexota bacterium]